MAEQADSATWNAEGPPFGMQALLRLAIWGGLTVVALGIAVISAYSSAGSQRQTAAITPGQGTVQPRVSEGEPGARSVETAEDARRLLEAVRALAADRDQLLARIAALERSLEGVTGTVKRDGTASPLRALPQNLPAPSAPAPVARPEMPSAPVTETAIIPAQTPGSQPPGPSEAAQGAAPEAGNRAAAAASNLMRVSEPPETLTATAGLGVDIGGALNFEGLRTLWHSTRHSNPALSEEIYPVVAVRENGKTRSVDLRLIIGPIANAEAAARLCTTLSAGHRYCQPVAFEGQRLSAIELAPKAAPASAHRPASGP